ncbi:MAG: radical SAM protein [Elusimicrobia bacterium]|nr:radical SAM protein [Elusimicrobiota bacterium]
MAKLLFLQNFDYEFLGPAYVSAMLKRHGHEARLKLGRSLPDFRAAIESFQPDLVGFSLMSGEQLWAVDLARQIKKAYGIRNVFGGPHPTFSRGFIEVAGVDLVVRGEAEETARDIMERVGRGQDLGGIPNTELKREDGTILRCEVRDLPADLDDYPFPDRTLYAELKGRIDTTVRNVITSRGCPFNCSFCFESTRREMYKGKGRYVRIRRIDRIIEELVLLKATTEVRIINFCDDLFGMDKGWLYEFLPVYKREIGLPFHCQVRADIVASDVHYAAALKEGLCMSVSMGVESGNERLRNKILNKQLSDDQIIRAAEYLHKAGVPFRSYNIMGLPGETLAEAFSTVDLNIRIKADNPWCAIFLPMEGTHLTDSAVQLGQLDAHFDYDQLSPNYFSTVYVASEHKRELENLHKFFQTACAAPRLWPLIKVLIRLPQNPLFNLWFCAVYFHFYLKAYRGRFWPSLVFAVNHARRMLESRLFLGTRTGCSGRARRPR